MRSNCPKYPPSPPPLNFDHQIPPHTKFRSLNPRTPPSSKKNFKIGVILQTFFILKKKDFQRILSFQKKKIFSITFFFWVVWRKKIRVAFIFFIFWGEC